jgi:hypothetical protein
MNNKPDHPVSLSGSPDPAPAAGPVKETRDQYMRRTRGPCIPSKAPAVTGGAATQASKAETPMQRHQRALNWGGQMKLKGDTETYFASGTNAGAQAAGKPGGIVEQAAKDGVSYDDLMKFLAYSRDRHG